MAVLNTYSCKNQSLPISECHPRESEREREKEGGREGERERVGGSEGKKLNQLMK